MQILHTEKGDVAVVRGFQANVNEPIIFETPDGKYIYRSMEPVSREKLVAMGIALPLKETFKLDEVYLEKEYRTAGGAHRAMLKKNLSDDEYMPVAVTDSDGMDSWVIRKKNSPEAAAFIQRHGPSKGSIAIEETPRG